MKAKEGANMSSSAPRRLLGTLSVAVILLTLAVAARADSNVSASVMLCQRGAYLTLIDSQGDGFVSLPACVTYAAHGGTLYPAAAAPCFNGGYLNLQDVNGKPFPDQQSCVDYVVAGGILYPLNVPAACQNGAYADLFPENGTGTVDNPSSTFTSESSCASWLNGSNPYGVLKPELRSGDGNMHFWLTVSGAAPTGTVSVCGDLALLVAYSSPRLGSGCLDPPVYGTAFQILYAPCAVGVADQMTVLLATGSGGVVGRTVTETCA
jgi:hypothetical protein